MPKLPLFASTALGALLAAALPLAALAAGPTISTVNPATAASNTPVTFTATVSSGVAIQYCHLYVDLEDVGDMTVSAGVASRVYTFASGGSRIAFVFCRDTSGGLGAGPNTSIWVTGAIVTTPPLTSTPSAPSTPSVPPATTPATTVPTTGLNPHSLVKLACQADAATDDPCKAVYYIGTDGKRHAFPNSKTYFTWYADFSSVQEVTQTQLSSYPLGKNVTYRPGVRMVKFQTMNDVYAVSAGGILRWVQTEDAARALYGADWNTKIDDIPDAFFSNYTYGANISSSGEYNPTSELTGSATFD